MPLKSKNDPGESILNSESLLESRIAELTEELKLKNEEIEKLASELHQTRETAELAVRAKSDFLANMSHELRTPLNAIIGYSEMLHGVAEDPVDDRFLSALKTIRGAGKRLLDLVDDILDISRIESGKMDLFLEHFDIRALIDEVQSTILPLVDKNGNKLLVKFENDPGMMLADLTKVRQSLFNLLSNAGKFTRNGWIELTITRRAGPAGDVAIFLVSDTGIGMSPEQIPRIFEPFVQADPSTTRKFGGTGLGLSISRHFCRMMGGDISVSSRPGEGSVFTMLLPCEVKKSGRHEND
ncbi:MAG: HAMP domain-containing histidine kinase [Acidobacteria bacterium]|nr:HAMP domain-containing histidine kinase [Acidobacteriota bacterium]